MSGMSEQTPCEAMLAAIRAALERHGEVLSLERAFGSSEIEAGENAATAYMLDIAEQRDRLLPERI